MSAIDLHIHSSYSDDGEYSPQQIVESSRQQGIELLAITDHNSVRGVAEAIKLRGELRVLSGVELDCTHCGRNFHLLGYGFDHTRQEFAEVEQDILRQEREAAHSKIELFVNATGIAVDAEAVLAASIDGVVTGELIAEIVLADKDAAGHELLRPYLSGGSKSDMPNVRFYWDFFSEGKPAYVPIRYLSLADAAKLIHSAGGIAVLAHPGQNLGSDDSLIDSIVSAGIDGIEAFSSYHNGATAARYLAVAEQYSLLVTCGSDFHGKHKPNIVLGGHGASWTDRQLADGLARLLG